MNDPAPALVTAPAPADGAWMKLLRTPGLVIPAAVAALNLGLTLFTLFSTLQDFPNSADEYAYLVSAKIFSRGQVSVPSPSLPRFFDVMHVVNNGKFYGKYPPGWPMILALGVRAGLPWIVNPLLGVATVFALHALARRHFSIEAANAATLSLLICPFLVFNSASYFSHSACLLAVIFFVGAVFNAVERPAGRGNFALMGLCAGLAFLIRPFTTVVLLAWPTLYLLLALSRKGSRKDGAIGLSVAALPFLACLALFFEYNRIQTGNPFLQPFEMYASWDVPGLPKDRAEWSARVESHVFVRTWDLNRWQPLCVLFLIVACAMRATRKDPKIGCSC
jgi:4-amino-4-deoxy-L-arabinose transferase-like glycosyltransferase